MKKFILIFILLVIVAIAGSIYYVFSNLDDLIKDAIETYGSQATQTSVRVESVNMRLTEGAGSVSGLTIANPKGFSMPLAFSLGEIRLGIDLQSLQQEPYVINEITVIAPEIFVEINKDNKINLNVLKNNLLASIPSADKTAGVKSEETAVVGPRLIIRNIKFADGLIKAKVAALGDKEYKLKLPHIEMTNLGGSKGLTPTELTSEIISRLSDQAVKQVKKRVIDARLEKIKAEAKAKLEAKKAEARAKLDAEKARLEAMKETKKQELRKKVKDKLKGLFRK